jgi:acylphosphatase
MQKCIEATMWGRRLGYEYLEWIRDCAIQYGLKGITFFISDGSIKVIAEGDERNIIPFINKLKKGRSVFFFMSPIENFSVEWQEPKNDFEDFSISESE